MNWREEEGASILTGGKGVLREGGRDQLAKSGWGQLMERMGPMCLMWQGCSGQVGKW